MNSISNITNKILADAEKEAQQIKDDAEKAVAGILSDYMRKAETESEQIIKDAEKEAETVLSTAMAKIDMHKRMENLACRRKIIDGAYDKAFQRITELPEDSYVSFMRNLLDKTDCDSGEMILN